MRFEFEGTMAEFRALLGHEPWAEIAEPPAEPRTGLKAHGLPEPSYIPRAPEMAEGKSGQLDRLPPIRPEVRAEVWGHFKKFCRTWVQGFEEEGVDQPDRPELMKELGQGLFPAAVMTMALEIQSLQRLVEKALIETGFKPEWEGRWSAKNGGAPSEKDWQDFYNRVSGTMIQISHVGFPELDGMYDYTQRWRRAPVAETANCAGRN